MWERSPLFLTREQFTEAMQGWEMEPVGDGPAVIFAVKGPEFHFCKLDDAYQAGREILKRYPGELIARHGFAITRTPKDDTRQQRFNRRLGGSIVGETQHDFIFKFERDRFARGEH